MYYLAYSNIQQNFSCVLSFLLVGVTTGVYMQQLGYTFMVQFAGCIASLVAVSLVAVIMDLFGKGPFIYDVMQI